MIADASLMAEKAYFRRHLFTLAFLSYNVVILDSVI